jgi:hypothetical protein
MMGLLNSSLELKLQRSARLIWGWLGFKREIEHDTALMKPVH